MFFIVFQVFILISIQDNLNARQSDAVLKVIHAVFEEEPKICLIQGPPGKGSRKEYVFLYGLDKNNTSMLL